MRRVTLGLCALAAPLVALCLPQAVLAQAGPLPAAKPAVRSAPGFVTPPRVVRPGIRRDLEARRIHRGPAVVPIYRPWYGSAGGSVVSQSVIVDQRRGGPADGLAALEDVRVVAGIRSAPAGPPTVYVLHPVPRHVADRARGPRIVEIDPGRAEEPGPGGPRIVHLPVRRH